MIDKDSPLLNATLRIHLNVILFQPKTFDRTEYVRIFPVRVQKPETTEDDINAYGNAE
jgi:hypothetical protein